MSLVQVIVELLQKICGRWFGTYLEELKTDLQVELDC